MSKKKNRNKSNHNPIPAVKTAQNNPLAQQEEIAKNIDPIHQKAVDDATEEEIAVVVAENVDIVSVEIDKVTLDTQVKKAQEAVKLLDLQKKRAGEAEKKAVEREKTTQTEKEGLVVLRQELSVEKQKLTDEKELFAMQELAIKEKEKDLLKREEQIVKREIDADAGFSERNRLALSSLEVEAKKLREEISEARRKFTEEIVDRESKLVEREKDLEVKLDQKRLQFDDVLGHEKAQFEALRTKLLSEIETQKQDLADEKKQLVDEKHRIGLDREILEEDQKFVEEKAGRIAAYRIEQLEHSIETLNEHLKAAREDRETLVVQLAAREEDDRRFGHQSSENIYQELKNLRKEGDELRAEIQVRPGKDVIERLSALEREREKYESENYRLKQENIDLERQLSSSQIAVTELETLRDEKMALKSSRDALHAALEVLRKDFDECVNRANEATPFRACSAFDVNEEMHASIRKTDKIENLEEFVEDLRHRMAFDQETGKTLYYSLPDLRSFLGGLAMSRLHLLQGISGTGKTSLPLAFARAIGAGEALIEVQAGWRDRQDLIGHYNAFEKVFYESEFLQALYRAQCPRYEDLPFIIILDEMNLSHPEQYFADFLSALEQDQNRQEIHLMPFSVPSPPRLLKDGRTLRLTPNIWFVGTANHDETTRDFADKTYDRSYILELPRNKDPFKHKKTKPRQPITFKALKDSFEEAKNQFQKDAVHSYKFIEEHLGEFLERRFKIGWGNRLERQIESYVPVVRQAGGSIGEATDYILESKLLRKLKDRHDTRVEDIRELRDKIQNFWEKLDKEKPVKSNKTLQQELHRLGDQEEA